MDGSNPASKTNFEVSSEFKQSSMMTGATASQLCEKFDSILCRKRHHLLKSLLRRDPLAGQLIKDLLTILVDGQLSSKHEISCNSYRMNRHSLAVGQNEVPPHHPSKDQSGISQPADDEQLLKLVSLKQVTIGNHENGKKLTGAGTASLTTATSNLGKLDSGRPVKYWRQVVRIMDGKGNSDSQPNQKELTTVSYEMKKFYDRVIGTPDIYPRVDADFQ